MSKWYVCYGKDTGWTLCSWFVFWRPSPGDVLKLPPFQILTIKCQNSPIQLRVYMYPHLVALLLASSHLKRTFGATWLRKGPVKNGSTQISSSDENWGGIGVNLGHRLTCKAGQRLVPNLHHRLSPNHTWRLDSDPRQHLWLDLLN